MKTFIITVVMLLLMAPFMYGQKTPGKGYKPIVLPPTYDHVKWGVEPRDLIYDFAAYTTSFDSKDLNPCLKSAKHPECDKSRDRWGIPEWVAYEIHKVNTDTCKPNYNRPGWMTDDKLNKRWIVPNDATYATPGVNNIKALGSNYRYVRGHMCPKDAADRISMAAGYNTHTMLNAVPQLQSQNAGIWKNLEEYCTEWANEYEKIWVICGPIFANNNPSAWLGQDGEVKAAIPDALFKIVIRKDGPGEEDITSLSFIFPNVISDKLNKKEYLNKYLTSIHDIQQKTGLQFLTEMTNSAKRDFEIMRHHKEITAEREKLSSSKRNGNNSVDDKAKTLIDDNWQTKTIAWTKCEKQ